MLILNCTMRVYSVVCMTGRRVYSKLIAVSTDHVKILITKLNEYTHSEYIFSTVICHSNFSVIPVTTDRFMFLITIVEKLSPMSTKNFKKKYDCF